MDSTELVDADDSLSSGPGRDAPPAVLETTTHSRDPPVDTSSSEYHFYYTERSV